jgi:hypothetical protein
MGCPASYDPVNNFPNDGGRFLLMADEKDREVPPKASQELLDYAKARGGRAELRSEFAHPFKDKDIQVHQARLALVNDFLRGSNASEEK